MEFKNRYMKESIKDQLRGICVKNESEEMGAEIVELYDEAGFENVNKLRGTDYNGNTYYGEKFGLVFCGLKSDFNSVLTIDQLRDIVRGKQAVKASNGQSLNNWTEIKAIMLEQAFKKLGLKPADIFSNPGSLSAFFSEEPTEELRRAWYKTSATYKNNLKLKR